MGLFRTVRTNLSCIQCNSAFPDDVQFKTDHDFDMPEHAEFDQVPDLGPGEYEGTGDARCRACDAAWLLAGKQCDFDALADQVARNKITIRRVEKRRVAAEDGGYPRAVEVALDAPPLTPDEIRKLVDAPDGHGRPYFAGRLSNHGLGVCSPDGSPMPLGPSSMERSNWWTSHLAAVDRLLKRRGWHGGIQEFVTVTVVVDESHTISCRT